MARKTSVLFYVSNEFRDAAKASPMSYADMARVIEMDERNLRNYLTGTLVFSLGVKPRLEKLAHVIGVPIADAVSQCAEDHLYDQPSTTDPLFVHNRKDGKLPRAK